MQVVLIWVEFDMRALHRLEKSNKVDISRDSWLGIACQPEHNTPACLKSLMRCNSLALWVHMI